jgi:DNA-binding XRE family transcriptional regulator
MAQPKNKIEALRRTNFLTQAEVANFLGMSYPGYAKIEAGQRGLSIDIARKLKVLFKVNHIEDLLDDAV